MTLLDRLIHLLERTASALNRFRKWWRGPKYWTLDLVKHETLALTIIVGFMTWFLAFFVIPFCIYLLS